MVRDGYLHARHRAYRYAPWNVAPEVDQVHIGICVAVVRDPYMDSARARTMWSYLRPIYGTLERDAEFQALGSALGMAYREVAGLEFRSGHYYLFLPPTQGNERLPCLVYLHGMGGNTKAHFWVLSRLTQHLKCVVIAPTFGIGNWDREGSGEFVADVVREALATLPVDAQRVFLLGYSNGAMGVTRAVIAGPTLFGGLMYLSPVTEDQLFSRPEFSARIEGTPHTLFARRPGPADSAESRGGRWRCCDNSVATCSLRSMGRRPLPAVVSTRGRAERHCPVHASETSKVERNSFHSILSLSHGR